MYGISPRLQRQFDKCQREHDNATPPGWEDDDREDCESGDCGDCPSCDREAKEYFAELWAENEYDRRHEL